MAKWEQATSSPIRCTNQNGYYFMSVSVITMSDGTMRNGIDICASSYKEAKEMFWAEFKDSYPMTYLTPRLSA